MEMSPEPIETPAKRLYSYICAEVGKMVTTRRINEKAIIELDQKVHYEAYIREKKDAILEDRRS